MADIVDPVVILFNDEVIRPLAERIRDMKAVMDDAAQRYVDDVVPLLVGNANTDLIEDGRAATGVSRMTRGDLGNMIVVLNDLKTTLEANTEIMDTVRKPTVRPLRVG